MNYQAKAEHTDNKKLLRNGTVNFVVNKVRFLILTATYSLFLKEPINFICRSKDDRVVSPDFATFSRPGELANRRLFCSRCAFRFGQPFGIRMWGSKCP